MGGENTAVRVALVHDYLLVLRGAERTFAAMADCWPEAPIYTTLYSEEGTEGRFAGREVKTSGLQRLGVGQRRFRYLLPLYPRAVERLPVSEFDLVVSSSSAFALGVRPRPDAVHVCYCHTPFRYAWHERDRALAEVPAALRPALSVSLSRIRAWDRRAAARVSRFVANSEFTRERIAAWYGREATVIHPPVDVQRFHVEPPDDYFLVVAELVPHKRVDIALEAARRAGRRIKVVGEGPELGRLRSAHGRSAEFLGRVSAEQLPTVYARARALVVANVEEFGIAAVEAQASGRPVLAVEAGGARETVLDGETGVLVGQQPDELAAAMRGVDFERFQPERIRAWAMQFSTERFKERLVAEVSTVVT
jgi:glycosyltransferase involved in cell wall biosynthesis